MQNQAMNVLNYIDMDSISPNFKKKSANTTLNIKLSKECLNNLRYKWQLHLHFHKCTGSTKNVGLKNEISN